MGGMPEEFLIGPIPVAGRVAIRPIRIEPLEIGSTITISGISPIARVPIAGVGARVGNGSARTTTRTRVGGRMATRPITAVAIAAIAIAVGRAIVRLIAPASDRGTAPCIVESLPLGIEATPTVAIALNPVVRIGRTVRASQDRAGSVVATGDIPWIGQCFDGRTTRILGNPHAIFDIVAVPTPAKDPTLRIQAPLVSMGQDGQQQNRHRQSERPIKQG